jgi:hypothetical protein
MLVDGRHRERRKDDDEDEDVVDCERLLDEIARGEFQCSL